jgi:hypothetical protein
MFTGLYIAKRVSKALRKGPKYRTCSRCNYQILNQLSGCPNCTGLSDEQLSELPAVAEQSEARPPELGAGLIISTISLLVVAAVGFWIVYSGSY